MFSAHMGPVTATAPALGMMRSVPESLAALAIAMATPECTVPTITSTPSRLMSLPTLSVAFDGSLSSSSLKPFSMAVPSAAQVPEYGSMRPTFSFCCAWAPGATAPTAAAASAAARIDLFMAFLLVFFEWVRQRGMLARSGELHRRAHHALGLVAVRRVPAVLELDESRLRYAPRDSMDLLHRAVFVVDALQREHRAADGLDVALDRPVAEGRIEPDVVPAPEGGIGIVVVARELRTQV